jgi:integrase
MEHAERHLDECCYAEHTKYEYRRPWRLFAADCRAKGVDCPARHDGEEFMARMGWLVEGVPERTRFWRKAIRGLFDVDETGRLAPGNSGWRRLPVPERFTAAVEEYETFLANRGLSSATVASAHGWLARLSAFMQEAGLPDPASLSPGLAQRFVAALPEQMAVSTRSTFLFFFRQYLRYLVDFRGADPALGDLFPVILVNRDAVLPSVYTADEVQRLIEAARRADGRSARRDLAVVLLAALTAMRSGDIKRLRLDQIDWEARRISFAQHKTGRRMVLPLPDECLFALLDYLRHERPATADQHMFLSARPPFGPLSDSYSMHCVVEKLFARAGIDVAGRHHGLHALRHSAAANMLLSNTPYPVVTGVLGHQNTSTTRRYLRVDVERLRPMALEVPDGN